MENVSIKKMLTGITDSQIKASKIKYQISKALYKKRKQMNMSQNEFAKFMNVSQGMVSKWESRGYNFTIESLCEIFEKSGVDFNLEIKDDAQGYIKMAESINKNKSPYENGCKWTISMLNIVGKAG